MATLIIKTTDADKQPGSAAARKAGVIPGRVVIGRLPSCGILIADSAVSRLHAWIDRVDGQYYINDCGSLTGTRLNGELISQRTPLADGDRVQISHTLIEFQDASEAPPDAEPIDLAGAPPGPPAKAGILFDCICGAPSWARWKDARHSYECRQCGQTVVVPSITGAKAKRRAAHGASGDKTPAATAPAKRARPSPPQSPQPPASVVETRVCSICQTIIGIDDQEMRCPACHLTFHAECWQENLGCSAYGCSQVNILKPHGTSVDAVKEAEEDDENHFPWEFILLGISAACVLLGALAFGIPPAVAALADGIYLRVARPRRRGVVFLAILIGLAGVAAGIVVSRFWWFDVPMWQRAAP